MTTENTILISAIICTWNRADYLRQSINSLVNQTLDKNKFEILIVDNRSTDNTRQMVQEEFLSLPNVCYIYEPISGLSQARNTGWQNAKGEYVAYLDDDAVASSNWLENILKAFANTSFQPECVGGKVDLIWPSPQPNWLKQELLVYFGKLDCSNVSIIFDKNQFLYGLNIAFSKRILQKLNGFQTELGRIGNKLISQEETLVQEKLREQGGQIMYDPNIIVHHNIANNRIKKIWFIKRLFWEGVSKAIFEKLDCRQPKQKKSLRELLKAIRRYGSMITLLRPTDNPDRLHRMCLMWEGIGYMYGYYMHKSIC